MGRAYTVQIGIFSAPPVGSVVSRWAGALGPTGFTSVAKTSGATTARLAASAGPSMTNPIYSGAVTPDANGVVKAAVAGLVPSSDYWYAWELGGGLDTTKIGRVHTPPSGPHSFKFAVASCDNGNGVADTYDRMKARNPLFFCSPGDLFYADITTNNQSLFRGRYDTLLASTKAGPFLAEVPIVYTWSDHDFADNNSVGTSGSGLTAKPAAQAVYRQYVPHYTLPDAAGIYQTFVIGRVRFVVTDNRSFKSLQTDTDNSGKTVLGATQKQWFKDTITAATEPLIFWLDDQSWSNYSLADDEWPNYNTERTELDTFVRASGKKIVILAGDMHALGYDDSANGPGGSGGMRVCQAAPVDNAASKKVDAMSGGVYPASGSTVVKQYGLVEITDTGGTSLTWAFTGYDTTDVARITGGETLTVPPWGG